MNLLLEGHTYLAPSYHSLHTSVEDNKTQKRGYAVGITKYAKLLCKMKVW